MKSRTSCCNGAILKKDFLRGAPLWAVYLLGWLAAVPLSMISNRTWRVPVEMQYLVLGAAEVSTHMIPFLYGLGAACLLFSFLYRSRSANFFAALPLRREKLFTTKYLTGLLYLLLPNVLIAVLTVVTGACLGANLAVQTLQWFAASFLSYVFYFSLAVCCAMVVGHLVALPLLYGVLNFAAVVLETIIRFLIEGFVYGWCSQDEMIADVLSPVFYFLSGNGLCAVRVYDEEGLGKLISCHLDNWLSVVILALVGAALAALAFWMYRMHRMESAGDVIAVRHLKPVFLYCFTVGCSLVVGGILTSMLISDTSTYNFLPILGCLLVGAVLGYFGGEMMLHKSLRVFRKRNWANCAVACLVIAAALCCARFDLFGYSRYVPELNEVSAVSLGYSNNESHDRALIAQVLDLHQEILSQQTATEARLRSGDHSRTVYVNYTLTDGRDVRRRYALPVNEETIREPDSLIRRYEAAYNDPNYIVTRNLAETYTQADIQRAYVYVYCYDEESRDRNEEIYLSAAETYELLKTAVEPDMRDGLLGTESFTEGYTFDDYNKEYAELQPEEVHWDVELCIEPVSNAPTSSWYLSIPAEATRTVQALIELGVPAEAFE